MEFKFGTLSILELGGIISEKLNDDGVTNQAELYIYVSEEDFKRIDEDLFLRNRKDEDEKFIPSEGEIIANVGMVKVIIKIKE